jgi:hypothetical protein
VNLNDFFYVVCLHRMFANFIIRKTFFPFNLKASPFQVKVF